MGISLVGANAHDTYAVSNRDTLLSPAIREAGNKALELAEVGVSDLARVDVLLLSIRFKSP